MACDQGEYREAIRQFNRLLTENVEIGRPTEPDEGLDRCLRAVEGAEQAAIVLREIASEYENQPAGVKALAVLARRDLFGRAACGPPSPLYYDLLRRFGPTREAARVILARAGSCLRAAGHEEEGLRDLERVAQEQAGNPEAAIALWTIGTHYRDREARDRATHYFQKVVDEYPETTEYPFHPGLKVVQFAKSDLEFLHFYIFSPSLDRLMKWLDRDLLHGQLGIERSRSIEIAAKLVPLLILAGALGLIVLLVAFLRRRNGPLTTVPGWVFVRQWSIWMTVGLLLGLESVRLLRDFAIVSCTDLEDPGVMSFLRFYEGADIILSVAVLVVVLSGESIARVFAIDRRRIVRLVVSILGGILGGVVLASVLPIPLQWLGLVPSGLDPNRHFSTDLTLPMGSWLWGAPLLLLWATTEEVLYRGVLHEALRRVFPMVPAAVLGSFVFALAHTRPLGATVSTFAIGLVLVLLRERLGSLAPSTACHFLWNVRIVAIRR